MFFLPFLSLWSLLLLFLSLLRKGIILRFFPSIHFGLFRRFFYAILNTSAFICRLLDIVKNTMFPMIIVFMLNLSCYMM